MANMWGSWAKQFASIFLKDGQNIFLRPNQSQTYTDAVFVELPAVDGDCVLLSRGEANADYQPLAANLTQLVALETVGLVGKNADGEIAPFEIIGYDNGGAYVSPVEAGNPNLIALGVSFDNMVAASASLTDEVMFGLVNPGFGTQTKKITIADLAALIGPGAFGYAATWDNDSTSIAITHNLNSLDVMVQLYDIDTNDTIMINQINRLDANSVHLEASEAPAGSGWRVLVQKIA